MAHSKILIASTLGLTFLVGALLTTLPKVYIGHLEERLGYFAESDVAKKLEVFDAASVNFLNHNPKYYFLGTGPGLIYLPAGDSILPRDQPIWGNHFEALPHMGAVLILSNSGLIGLLFFLFILWVGARSKMRKEDFILLVIGCMLSGIFLIQLHYYFIFGFACLFARTRLSLREEKLS